MPRLRRLKSTGQDAYYHIITRTVGREFFLGDEEKEKFVSILRRYSLLYFVKINTYCIMSNHWHLLLKVESGDRYGDDEILRRLKNHYGKFLPAVMEGKDMEYFREKLGDISSFVQMVKQSFSRWYNKVNERSGYFWGDRFKSVLVEDGAGLLNCMTYIDLNPVRAGLVERPEDYRWSGIGVRTGSLTGADFLTFDGTEMNSLREYSDLLYNLGGIDRNFESKKGKIEGPSQAEEKLYLFRKRSRYFTDGLVLGSKLFIKDAYAEFSGKVIFKKDRKIYDIGTEDSTVFSIKRLRMT